MRLLKLFPVILALGCGGNGGGGGNPDAATPPPAVDAAAGAPDAAPGTPDAMRAQPPDARPGQPDARPGQPDARPAPPDAARPDAGPTCAGTWEAIPPLVIAGNPIVPEATTSNGDTLYYLYVRPGNAAYHDLASYSPATGWRAYQSTNPVDIKLANQFAVRGDHAIVFYIPTETGDYPHQRAVLGLADHAWTVTYPYADLHTDVPIDEDAGFGAIAGDSLVYYGHDFAETYPGEGFARCWSDSQTTIVSLDDPEAPVVQNPSVSPLGSRGGVAYLSAGDQAFVWGGIPWPYPPQYCIFNTPDANLDGAFFDPASGVWSVPISIPPAVDPSGYNVGDRLLWTGAEVLLLDYSDWGAHSNGRLHRAAPGAIAFQTVDLPGDLPVWSRYDFSRPNIAPVADGMVGVYGSSAYHFAPATNTLTSLCPPPTAFPTNGDATEPYGAVTSTGAVLARGGVAAYLKL